MTHTPIYRKQSPTYRVGLLSAAVALALISNAETSYAQDALAEEIIVTGSFIRRSEGLSAASPVTQLTAEDLEAQGTLNMAQIVQNLSFNNGTAVTDSIQGTSSSNASFNLRGLGERATLQLVDGKRLPTGNVQRLLPNIAIERMDIVTDGAAALYGTDAVAGVVNMVPYKSYEGTKLEYYEEGDSRGDFRDSTISFITGRSFGNGVDAVLAGSFRHTGTLEWADRPSLMTSGLTHNSGANPANYNVPQRDANGVLTGASVSTPEPACGTDPNNDPTVQGSEKFGTLALGRCWLSFGDTRDFFEATDTSTLFGNLNWEVNDDLNFSTQIMLSRLTNAGRQNPGNPGARFAELPIVRGELPGNPFRAVASDGRELFAQPLRDNSGNIVTDGHGQPLPLRDSNGAVLLATNQFADISTDAQGGVPFNEDVPMSSAWLPFGKANTLPSIFKDDGINRRDDDDRAGRLAFTADYRVPFLSDWRGTSFYTLSINSDVGANTQQFSFSAVEQGLNCDVVNDHTACFNPFGAPDPRFLNSQAVADSIYTRDRTDHQDTLQTFDTIINGTISPGGFELAGGPIGAAFGYQRRDEEDKNVPELTNILNDQLIGVQVLPNTTSRTSDSYFGEFSFPVLSNLELTYAIRDEQFSTGQGDVVQKYGLIYSPTDWFTLRATRGEAFIVPTLPQLNSPESCGLSNVDDLFTAFSGFITSCSTGNPALASESSNSKSVSLEFAPLDDLFLSVTWSETDFSDRIVSTTTQDIVRTDFANFQRATGFVPTAAQPFPSVAQLTAWVANPLSDPRIERDPADIETTTRIQQSDSNASNMLVKAFDINASYAFEIGDLGSFNASLQATYVDTYQFQLSQLDPVLEAAGAQNNSYGAVAAIPEWRANARLGWSRGNHSASATVRYIDEVTFDANEFSFQAVFPGSTWRHTDVIRAWTQLDAFYTYRDLSLLNGNASFTLGMRNVTDREAQKTGMIAGVAAELQDPRARVIYARMNYEF